MGCHGGKHLGQRNHRLDKQRVRGTPGARGLQGAAVLRAIHPCPGTEAKGVRTRDTPVHEVSCDGADASAWSVSGANELFR